MRRFDWWTSTSKKEDEIYLNMCEEVFIKERFHFSDETHKGRDNKK